MCDAATVVATAVGPVTLECREGRLVRVRFDDTPGNPGPPQGILLQAVAELEEYFAGRRRTFSVPLTRPAASSAFQHRVWDAMLRIPYGATRTYGELAAELGSSPRAVGGACGRNALPIFIPCHRVVAAGGLGGYSGDWETGKALAIKRILLELEGSGG